MPRFSRFISAQINLHYVNDGRPGDQEDDATARQRIWRFGILASALIAILATGYCLSFGIFVIFSHLFYIPIVMIAYWYPRRGVAAAGLLAAVYIGEVLLLSPADAPEVGAALIRSGIFVAVAAVVSHLAGRLQSREDRYRGIFDTSEAGIFLFHPDTGAVEEMNRQCVEIFGRGPEDISALTVSAIWPEYRESGEIRNLLETASPVKNLECEVQRRDGTAWTALLSASLLPDQRIVCAVITDTTEQKRMENRLRRSEKAIRAILDSVDVGIVVTNLGGEIVEANEAAVRLYGGSRDDLVGKSPDILVAERDRALALSYWERVLREGSLSAAECRFHRKDGTEWLAEVSATLLKGNQEVPEGLILVLRDITDRRGQEEEMRMHNKRLSIINEIIGTVTASPHLDDLLQTSLSKTLDELEFDLGGVYLLRPGTDVAELRYRQGMDDGLCKALPPAVHRDEPIFRDVLLDGQARFVDSFPGLQPGDDDTCITSFAAVPIRGGNGSVGCFAIASKRRRTISESERLILTAIGEEIGNAVVQGMLREELEGALASANRYLEETNAATEEANLYIDILSHDINNANTAAMGYLQMMIDLADDSIRKIAQKSLTAIQQSSEIIRNVTTLRKLRHETTVLRPVRLDSVIRNQVNYFSDARIAYGGTDVEVMADDLIGEVFANLIGNSIKFGGPDTRIAIEVRNGDGGDVAVTITDTGPGIPDDLKPRIFQRYQRGTSKKSGKGLGLYISRMLVERYGGRVFAADRVAGHPEEGAAVTFTVTRYHPKEG
jgi:PAS domain S-box-containing protein